MRRLRAILMTSGALVAALVCIGFEIVLASREDGYERQVHRSALAGCTRSRFIRPMFFCGARVMYRNPDGSIVVIGTTKQLSAPHAHIRPVAP